MNVTTVPLADGGAMPSVGLGCWKIEKPVAAEVVAQAARLGYRHFDSACDYGNEAEIGDGLVRAIEEGVAREDLWVTSKLWNTYHRPEHVRPAIERSLSDLKLDYLDLYLIHFPISLAYVPFEERYPPGWTFDPEASQPAMKPDPVPIAETWAAMEELVTLGLTKRIGVCNFPVALLRDLLSYRMTRPAVLQVEMHPYLTQEKLLRFCKESGIAVTAFSPFGAPSYVPLGMATADDSAMSKQIVHQIAFHHHRTPAQVLLRWGVQRGTAVIPKTARPERLAENIALFDFELTADEMKRVDSLNRDHRFNDPGVFGEQAFGTFFPIYE
jgi:D-xylose reductase